jgi:hypothetical protein
VARETPQPRLDATFGPKRPRDDGYRHYSKALCHDREDDHSDGDCCDSDSSYSSKSKRRRISESPSAEEQQPEEVIFWDYSRNCTPHSERLSGWTTRTKVMDNTSIAGPGRPSPDRPTCNLEGWQDLKQLFAKAVEMYESALFSDFPHGVDLKIVLAQEPSETIPLLRGVIHECHHFMKAYHDPSVLFATPPQPPETRSVFSKERDRYWLTERPPLYPPADNLRPQKREQGQSSADGLSVKPAALELSAEKKWYELPLRVRAVFKS